MRYEEKSLHFDLVVVGGGVPGVCCAVQAAREGLNVALINDRGCLGGNSSCEINVCINGANDGNALNVNGREGGIVDEIRQEAKYRSLENNRYALDGVYMDFVDRAGVHLYLNTCIDEAETGEDGRVVSVSGTQNTTETRFRFFAPLFVDDTGDGALGALAGAEYMLGREGKATFNERIAPDEADACVIPSTLSFTAHDTGAPVTFIPPDCAVDIEKSGALKYREIPHNGFNRMQWYYEGDGSVDQVKERETIIRDHRALVYGIWNYIKNSGKYPEAKNYDLEYVSVIPGMREYRRLKGDWILTEDDLVNQREYEDCVGHGGWNIDLHAIHGFFDTDLINRHINFRGLYQIPFRTGYSRNVPNLMMCGRCMSASHVAFGSARVAATLSTLGQALGMAAKLCLEYDELPRGIYERHSGELKQRLLREDQLIPGEKNEDPRDMARGAMVEATSEQPLRSAPVSGYLPVGEGWALSLPVAQALEELILYTRAEKEATLRVRVYRPEKPYNYGPDILIEDKQIPVGAGDCEISVPLQLDAGSYYLIRLDAEGDLSLGFAGNCPPNSMMFRCYQNRSANVWDYASMRMSDVVLGRYGRCAAFRTVPEQRVYRAENVVNGYNRAYGQPNMWLSSPDDPRPSLTLRFDSRVRLDTLQITFAIDTTVTIYHYDKRVFPLLARDWEAWAIRGGERTLLCRVRDNHM
ncbi:MAG: FAD-dependent oxidoreductase, partial [Clostridia bacterium]|nr:FAD-dependent oxidoreductase [Clostridia bacterium]